jgi:membrane protein
VKREQKSSTLQTLLDFLSSVWLVVRESVISFNANANLETAATLAYYGFLSLMPLLLLAIFVLGIFMHSSEAVMSGVRSVIHDILPTIDEAVLDELLTLSQKKVWGLIGVIVLIWSMTPFARAVRHSICGIFKLEQKLHFFKAKLLDLVAVLTLLTMFLLTVTAKVYFVGRYVDTAPDISFVGIAARVITPVALTTMVIFFFYFVFAPVRLRPGPLLAGAVTTTILLAVMKPLFGLLLTFNPNFGYAFGSLKTLFLLIVWVYYTFAVVLFGAEIMANIRRKEALLLRGFFMPGKRTRIPSRLVQRFVLAFEPGEEIFHEGDMGHQMFYVASGAVELRKADQLLKTAVSGDYFGEMSMLIDSPRTATAVAGADTQIIAISGENFGTILRENPQTVHAILREMALRLKATNEQLKNKT